VLKTRLAERETFLLPFCLQGDDRMTTQRRDFLKTGVGAGIGFWVAGGVGAQDQPRRPGPNDRLNVAFIGAGGKGGSNLDAISRTENVVALCDTDDRRAKGAYDKFPMAARYKDFRRMLETQRNIDAVVVSTPDHQHAIASIMAMRLGKHCYTEKPLSHDVWEARKMKETAAQYRVATQMGNQGSSHSGLRRGVEVVRSGALGKVTECHVWTNRPIWPQGMTQAAAAQPVPEGLDWDLWLGTAPERPYNEAYVPFKWRGWWDFGTGAIGDMACHTMNLAYRALSLDAPTAVQATARQPINNQTPPEGCTIVFEFPARRVAAGNGYAQATELPAARMTWYERGFPERELFRGILRDGQNPSGSGCLIIGELGTMYSPSDYGSDWVLLPKGTLSSRNWPEPSLPRTSSHYAEWIQACKGGPAAFSNFVDYASQLTEAALLGNVALRAGGRIEWDTQNLRVTNNESANRFVRREYRRGWEI
jgi:predicted dehydrogenase